MMHETSELKDIGLTNNPISQIEHLDQSLDNKKISKPGEEKLFMSVEKRAVHIPNKTSSHDMLTVFKALYVIKEFVGL